MLTTKGFMMGGMLDNDIKDLDAPAFTNIAETVINYKGENYYKACPEQVTTYSFCVKRVNHPGDIHEDYEGNTRS